MFEGTRTMTIFQLFVLAYARGFTQWHYKHSGDMSQVFCPGFFSDVADLIAPQDRVSITANDGSAECVFFGEGKQIVAVPMMLVKAPTS